MNVTSSFTHCVGYSVRLRDDVRAVFSKREVSESGSTSRVKARGVNPSPFLEGKKIPLVCLKRFGHSGHKGGKSVTLSPFGQQSPINIQLLAEGIKS